MKFRSLLAAVALVSAMPGSAQSVKSEITTSSGIAVTLHADEFAGRYEYSAPIVNIDNRSYAIVVAVVEDGKVGPIMIVGSIMYTGDWRRYQTAIFRGGEEVESSFNDRDVVTCRGSRYGGCSLREGFRLMPTAAQIEKYATDGKLAIQVRAQSSDAMVMTIPVSHVAAIEEAVAKHR